MDMTLKHAADRLGTTRPQLIRRMREAGLLDSHNLPANPSRDALYLKTKEGQWFHPELGMQYSRSTRVTLAGLPWLAERLGIERPLPPPTPDRRDVA